MHAAVENDISIRISFLAKESRIISSLPRSVNKGEITILLERVSSGDCAAQDALISQVYRELHGMAMRRLSSERNNHTLQATALVNEAFMKLCTGETDWQNRGHFFSIAAHTMRNILVDYARRRNALKGPGRYSHAQIDEAIVVTPENVALTLEMNDLLERLSRINPRQAHIVELRFFGGRSEEEIAVTLNMSARNVRREWAKARVWLYGQLVHA